MKKFSLFIAALVLIVFFAGVDYLINTPRTINQDVLSQLTAEGTVEKIVKEAAPTEEADPNLVQAMLADDPYPYTLQKRNRTSQLFEAFDVRSVSGLRVYKNVLDGVEPIIIYEGHGLKGQGKLTYLNVKLAMMAQIGPTGTINEVNDITESNLFYNEESAKNTAFLLIQIQDKLFGFQYNRQNPDAFETVRDMIDTFSTLNFNS